MCVITYPCPGPGTLWHLKVIAIKQRWVQVLRSRAAINEMMWADSHLPMFSTVIRSFGPPRLKRLCQIRRWNREVENLMNVTPVIQGYKPRPPTCAMTCQYSPQRSQSNGKSNFQNELTNQKFDSISKLNLACRQQHNVKPITLFHFPKVLQSAKQFWSLKRSHHYGIFIGCNHGTGRAQLWNLAVTCNVTVAIVKTIVIVAYLPYQPVQN